MQVALLWFQMKIGITGAGGQVAYALIPALLRAFDSYRLSLVLLDKKENERILQAVKMEIEDLGYGHIVSVEIGSDLSLFEGVKLAVFLGASPRTFGMERKDLIRTNSPLFYQQGRFLANRVDPNFRGLVVGNPSNTNALMMIHGSEGVWKNKIHSLMRLDQNRAKKVMDWFDSSTPGPFIFGNHSTQLFVKGAEEEVNRFIGERGSDLLRVRGTSSAKSAAKAIVDHLEDWCSFEEKIFSAGCYSESNAYGIDPDLVFSFPFSNQTGIVTLPLSAEEESRLRLAEKELIEEREIAWSALTLL